MRRDHPTSLHPLTHAVVMILRACHILPLGMIAAAVSGCNPCENQLVSRIRSPDGGSDAVSFVRSCGATTEESFQVSIIRPGDALPGGSGNVLVADAKDDPRMDPAHVASFRWTSSDRLLVTLSPGVRTFRQDTLRSQIHIVYVRPH
jgi:hypothetical protein